MLCGCGQRDDVHWQWAKNMCVCVCVVFVTQKGVCARRVVVHSAGSAPKPCRRSVVSAGFSAGALAQRVVRDAK